MWNTRSRRQERSRQLQTALSAAEKAMVHVNDSIDKAHLAYCRVAALQTVHDEDVMAAEFAEENEAQIFQERISAKEQMDKIKEESKVLPYLHCSSF